MQQLPIHERAVAYIYALKDPRDNRVRYIGKTSWPSRRYSKHLSSSALLSTTHKNNWIKAVMLAGFIPQMVVLEKVSIGDWKSKEIHWIKRMRKHGVSLTNTTKGGEGQLGVSPTPETKRKISEKLMGHSVTQKSMEQFLKNREKVFTPEGRRNRLFGWMGWWNGLSQKSKSEIISRRAEGNRGKTVSEEVKEILRAKNLGKVQSAETIQKRADSFKKVLAEMPDAKRANMLSNLTSGGDKRAKAISQGLLGHKVPQEVRDKISASLRKSRYPGVIADKTGRWMARVGVSGGKQFYLGIFESEDEAGAKVKEYRDSPLSEAEKIVAFRRPPKKLSEEDKVKLLAGRGLNYVVK